MRHRVAHHGGARLGFRLMGGVALCAMAINTMAPLAAAAVTIGANDDNTTTPIKHVIVIIGENRTFDHLFATQPVNSGETVLSLLSEGIVKADGTPAPNYSNAAQFKASDTTVYQLSPSGKSQYTTLLAPRAGGG
jgi:phospholipase C